MSAVVTGVFLLNYSRLTKSDSDILDSFSGILETPFCTSFSLVTYSLKYFCLYIILSDMYKQPSYHTENRYVFFVDCEIENLYGFHDPFQTTLVVIIMCE